MAQMGGLLTSIGDEETNEQEPEPAQEAEMMIAVSVAAMTADDVLGCCEQLQVLASFTHSLLVQQPAPGDAVKVKGLSDWFKHGRRMMKCRCCHRDWATRGGARRYCGTSAHP
jgi:hypothetical protein